MINRFREKFDMLLNYIDLNKIPEEEKNEFHNIVSQLKWICHFYDAHPWHNLKDNPDDLPQKNQQVIIAMEDKKYLNRHLFFEAFYDGHNCWWQHRWRKKYLIGDCRIIAWKDIIQVPPVNIEKHIKYLQSNGDEI